GAEAQSIVFGLVASSAKNAAAAGLCWPSGDAAGPDGTVGGGGSTGGPSVRNRWTTNVASTCPLSSASALPRRPTSQPLASTAPALHSTTKRPDPGGKPSAVMATVCPSASAVSGDAVAVGGGAGGLFGS